LNKREKTLTVAVSEEDLMDVDLLRSKMPFPISRSSFVYRFLCEGIRSMKEEIREQQLLDSVVSVGLEKGVH
jgi:hypothetical protein